MAKGMKRMRDAKRRWTMVLALVALGSAACTTDDGDNDTDDVLDSGTMDSGPVKVLDAATDSAADSTAPACRSWTLPTETMCGGPNCLQNFAQLTASAKPGAVCGGETDLRTLCSLKGPDAVGQCSVANVMNRSNIGPCSAAALGSSITPACLACYVKSADCAFENCISECLAGTNNVRCDNCRYSKGCGQIFYDCAGLEPPPR